MKRSIFSVGMDRGVSRLGELYMLNQHTAGRRGGG
jgi:hypothetical protein